MITLWGRNNSTNVKKVRWVLAELGPQTTGGDTGYMYGAGAETYNESGRTWSINATRAHAHSEQKQSTSG